MGLVQSMSKRGNCWDNAPQESFFGHFKDECGYGGCESFE
jgi:transposase InsO family protein